MVINGTPSVLWAEKRVAEGVPEKKKKKETKRKKIKNGDKNAREQLTELNDTNKNNNNNNNNKTTTTTKQQQQQQQQHSSENRKKGEVCLYHSSLFWSVFTMNCAGCFSITS